MEESQSDVRGSGANVGLMENAAHIVHLTTVHRPFDTRIFHKECKSLVKAGFRVSLVAPHTIREVVDGVQVLPVPRFKHRLARMTLGIWSLFRFARHLAANVYHFHDPELMPVGIMLKLTTRACIVYDVHENYPTNMYAKEWLPRPLRRISSFGVEQAEKLTDAMVDGVVAPTEYIGTRFNPAKTQIVKNYPPLATLDLVSEEQRDYNDNFTLIYTGGLTAHRGVDQIVGALAYVKTPQARLTLLGRNLDQNVANTIEAMPGYNRVDYLGHVPYETMYQHLQSSAVGLVCNQPRYGYDLAQPNKLFEYMSAGLPVIASDFELWKEIIEGNQCGVTVDPTSPDKIAEAIDDLLGHPEDRRKMGENARRAITEKYNWDRESQKLLELYRKVLEAC